MTGQEVEVFTLKPGTMDPERDALAALELRAKGHSYRHIAAVMQCAPSEAHRRVKKALAWTSAENGEQVRELELSRLDQLWETYFGRAKEGDQKAAAICLRVMERRSKLLGLDQVVEYVQVITDEVIKAEIRRMNAELTAAGIPIPDRPDAGPNPFDEDSPFAS